MTTDVFNRLSGASDPKLPIHGIYAGLILRQRGLMTEAQFNAFFGTDAADWSTGDLSVLVAKQNAVTNARDKVAFGRDLWLLLLLMEIDDDNLTGLRTPATFSSRLDDLVTFYNSLP